MVIVVISSHIMNHLCILYQSSIKRASKTPSTNNNFFLSFFTFNHTETLSRKLYFSMPRSNNPTRKQVQVLHHDYYNKTIARGFVISIRLRLTICRPLFFVGVGMISTKNNQYRCPISISFSMIFCYLII